MASLSIWLGGIFLVGLVALGATQTLLSDQATGTGMVAASSSAEPQRDLNLCLNGCMRDCVTSLESEAPCREHCNSDCGA